MNPMLMIKLIDAAVIFATLYMKRAPAEAAANAQVDRLLHVRNRVLKGEITTEEAQRLLVAESEKAMEGLNETVDALPEPTHPSYSPSR